MRLPKFFRGIAFVATAVCFSLALCFAIMAWSGPGATPPDGNVAAPINTSGNAQTKSGDFKIGTGLTIGSVGTAFVLKNDAGTSKFVVGQDGNIGIGTTAPAKNLEVVGDTKSTQFCLGDQCCSNWNDCKAFAPGGGCGASATFYAFAGVIVTPNQVEGPIHSGLLRGDLNYYGCSQAGDVVRNRGGGLIDATRGYDRASSPSSPCGSESIYPTTGGATCGCCHANDCVYRGFAINLTPNVEVWAVYEEDYCVTNGSVVTRGISPAKNYICVDGTWR
jgi:hypothetical protein